jgi:hypothetical protein
VAPDGYSITTDTKFQLKEDGTIDNSKTTTTVKDGVLLVEDAKTHVSVSKVDIADGEELEGATIQIIDSKGKVVEEWTSTKEAHEIEGLKTGEEYTLRETVAPDGYTVTTDTKFTIDEEGNVTSTGSVSEDGVLLVEDAKTSIKVKKTDIADGKELAGAKIQIKDKDGKVVEEWTSTKEAHVVEGLKTGVVYTLHETVAPQGYDITADTKFSINPDGTVKRISGKIKDGVILVEDSKTGGNTETPTPETTPAPGPISLSGKKIWVDEDNYYNTRPESITLQLFGNGELVMATPTWKNTKTNTWTYTYDNLPSVDADGAKINYTVKEVPVENYETTIDGTTIVNTLIPKGSEKFTELSGVKTWDDNNNAGGKRPTSITVRLLRNGVEVATRTVTAANGWKYDFGEQPVDTGYGTDFKYEVREDAVPGYYCIKDGMNLINRPITDTPEDETPDRKTHTPKPKFKGMKEEEFDDLLDILDYGTPLFGMLGTGDETPVYPFVFGGLGAMAVAILLATRKKRRKA